MKLLFHVLFWTCLGSAQVVVGNFGVNYVTTAPSGTCSKTALIQVVMGAGTAYTCQNGTWAQSGASSPPGGSDKQLQVNNAAAFGGISNGTAGQILVSNGASSFPSFQAAGSVPVYVFNETPTGAINSSNVTYTLANSPNPSGTLELFRNGILQIAGSDFTLSAATVTYVTAPRTGDTLVATYQNGTTSGSLANPIQTATVTLSAAQVKTLKATPVQVIAAPGAGKLNNLVNVFAQYKFGTREFQGGNALELYYNALGQGSGEESADIIGSSFLDQTASQTFYEEPNIPLVIAQASSGNQAVMIATKVSEWNAGAVATNSLGAGGSGYAAGDTGTLDNGNADATYQVLTVAAGSVVTYSITGGGNVYRTGISATTPGGGQPGAGSGFTVNVTGISAGDDTLTVTAYYTVVTLQ